MFPKRERFEMFKLTTKDFSFVLTDLLERDRASFFYNSDLRRLRHTIWAFRMRLDEEDLV